MKLKNRMHRSNKEKVKDLKETELISTKN